MIDFSSEGWRTATDHFAKRRAVLVEQCIAPTATDEQRRDAASRIDEIDTLLRLPTHMAQAAAALAAAPASIY